jgi:tRNA A-37 threonylcarbamoyl transferase component Bud32
MSQDLYINELEWSYRQAELAKKLERKRQLAEAKSLTRLAHELDLKLTGTNYSETTNNNNKNLGKETLGWN